MRTKQTWREYMEKPWNQFFYFSRKYIYYYGKPNEIAYERLNFPVKTKWIIEESVTKNGIMNTENLFRKNFV